MLSRIETESKLTPLGDDDVRKKCSPICTFTTAVNINYLRIAFRSTLHFLLCPSYHAFKTLPKVKL